ncbi:hypothetical protein EV2_037524 [Malus domestica]
MFASLPCHEAQRLTHRDFPIIQQWYCSFTLVGNNMVARPSKFMGLNFVSAVSLLFFYPSWSERCSGSCKLHVLNFGKVICEVFDRMPIISAKLSVRVTGADKAGKVGASSISEIGPRGLWGAQLLRKRAPLRFLRSAFVVFEQPNF